MTTTLTTIQIGGNAVEPCRRCLSALDVAYQPAITNGGGFRIFTCRNASCLLYNHTFSERDYVALDLFPYNRAHEHRDYSTLALAYRLAAQGCEGIIVRPNTLYEFLRGGRWSEFVASERPTFVPRDCVWDCAFIQDAALTAWYGGTLEFMRAGTRIRVDWSSIVIVQNGVVIDGHPAR